MAQPVFYDPRRARWKRLRTLLDVAGIVVSAVIVVFIYTAVAANLCPSCCCSIKNTPTTR